MISSLDYLDNDVSHLLSRHISARRTYNNVMKDLNKLIDMNICAKYLKSFDFNETLRGCKNPSSMQIRLRIAEDILSSEKKTGWLYNFPTKFPGFYDLSRPGCKRDIIKRLRWNDYMIEETGWRLKIFPPPKDLYQINKLKLLKKKKPVMGRQARVMFHRRRNQCLPQTQIFI